MLYPMTVTEALVHQGALLLYYIATTNQSTTNMLSRYSKSHDEVEEKTKERKRFGLFRSRSKVTSEEKNKYEERDEDEIETEEARINLFNKAEKKQKKVVYNQFSDDPKVVLEVESEDGIPEITDRNQVVVKVQVSQTELPVCARSTRHALTTLRSGINSFLQ